VDLNRLALFVQLAESGSFTQAALKLRQPKSRVSRQLKDLERELGLNLVYRTTRQFQLTDAGRELYLRTKEGLQIIESAAQSAEDRRRDVRGRIRLTAPEDLGLAQLNPLIIEFSKSHPHVEFDLIYSGEVRDLVKEGIDLAFRFGRLKDSSLLQRRLGRPHFMFVASPTLLDRLGSLNRLEQLEQFPFLEFTPLGLSPMQGSAASRGAVDRRDGTRQKWTARARLRMNSLLSLRDLALAGHGVTTLPEFLARDHLKDGTLIHVLKNYGLDAAPLHLVSPPASRSQALAIRNFAEFCIERLKDL